jgi:hypothetical protein
LPGLKIEKNAVFMPGTARSARAVSGQRRHAFRTGRPKA